MRPIAASILVFEALIVVLAIPVAISLGDVDPAVAGVGGGLLAVACVGTAGMLSRPWGYRLGWLLQIVLVLSGFVVTAMFFLGGLFAVLWWIGLRVGRRGEELGAQRRTEVDDPKGDGTSEPG